MSNTGKLVVFSGFSGSGKGTIMKELMAKHGDDYALSVSATTRGPRPGEEHGREYFFISEEEFEQMIKADGLLEYAKYVDHYYGTPKSYVNEQLSAGKNVILEIEIQGALKIKKQFPDTVLMFVSAPSADELKDRLVGRGTEVRFFQKSIFHLLFVDTLLNKSSNVPCVSKILSFRILHSLFNQLFSLLKIRFHIIGNAFCFFYILHLSK